MSQEFQQDLVPFLLDGTEPENFPLLVNISEATKRFFLASYKTDLIDHLFIHYQANSRDYRVWSFYIDKPGPNDLADIQSDLDAIASTYSQDFIIMGAWQVATGQAVADYPSPPSLINFMPPTWDHSTNPPTEIPPTGLSDVVLLAGQAPRVFI